MKKLILLSAFAVATISVNAQGTAKPQTQQEMAAADKASKMTSKVAEMVTLTPDQKEKVYAIALQKEEKMKAAAANKATFETEKAKIKQESEDAIMALLTLDQQTKFKAALAEQKRKAAAK